MTGQQRTTAPRTPPQRGDRATPADRTGRRPPGRAPGGVAATVWRRALGALRQRRARLLLLAAAAAIAAAAAEGAATMATSERAAAAALICVGLMLVDVAAGVIGRGARAAWRGRPARKTRRG